MAFVETDPNKTFSNPNQSENWNLLDDPALLNEEPMK